MKKTIYSVKNGSVEITAKDLHSKYLPSILEDYMIEYTYWLQFQIEPEEVAVFGSEEEAVNFCCKQNHRSTKIVNGAGGRYFFCEVSYVEEIVEEWNEKDENGYDFRDSTTIGIAYFIAEEYSEEEKEEEE